MKAQIINAVVKAAPYVKKAGPIIASSVGAAFQAFSDQKAAARIDNLEQRIKDLEAMLNNK